MKKHLTIVSGGLLVTAATCGIVVWQVASRTADKHGAHSTPPALVSQHNMITLNTNQQTLSSAHTQLSGTFQGKKHVNLFYAIAVDNAKGLIAAGSIQPDAQGKFSRNIAIPEHVAHKSKLQLNVYAQNEKGKKVDHVTTTITYK